METLSRRLARYLLGCFLSLMLVVSPVYAAKPLYYDGSSNTFYDMFMAMMDLFGMVDVVDGYGKYARNPYSMASPFGMGSYGLNPMTGMNPMTGVNPWQAMNGMNQLDSNKWLSQLNPNPSFNGLNRTSYKSPLEGVWLATGGDVLVFMGSRFFYRANGRHLVGNAQISENRIIADIDDSEEVVKFQYETKGKYLAVKVSDKDVIYFQRQL